MKTNPSLELKKRREIYEFISHNSGLHMRDISRKIDIPFTTLKYHLRYLENKGLLVSRKDGKFNRYFVSLEVSEHEKKILACFRRPTTLYIILMLFITVQCSQKEMSKYLGKHPATINFHLRHMLNAGIIEQVPIDQGVIYKEKLSVTIKRLQVSSEKIYVFTDPWMIYNLLVKHQEHLGDKADVAGIIDYIEFYISEGVPHQIQNRQDTKQSVCSTLYGFFFPPSFCY